jgi:hypothetical protein
MIFPIMYTYSCRPIDHATVLSWGEEKEFPIS